MPSAEVYGADFPIRVIVLLTDLTCPDLVLYLVASEGLVLMRGLLVVLHFVD